MKSTFPYALVAILFATLLFSCDVADPPAADEAVESVSQRALSDLSASKTHDDDDDDDDDGYGDNVVHVTINYDGTCTPDQISVERGDMVIFHAYDLDAGLCIDRGEVFGAKHFGIPKGNKLKLVVQDFAPSDPFTYTVHYGSLTDPCPGSFGGDGEVI